MKNLVRNHYEMPTNEDLENLLVDNLKKHTKNMEFIEKEVNGEKQLFPFWVPVAQNTVHYSRDSYLTEKQKAEKKLTGNSIIDTIQKFTKDANTVFGEEYVNSIKPLNNELNDTKTNKQIVTNDTTKATQQQVSKQPSQNVVPVKNELSGTSTSKQVTEFDSTITKSDVKVLKGEPKVTSIKNDLSHKTTKQVITNDTTEIAEQKLPKSVVQKVTPKSEIGAISVGGIDFSRFYNN